MDILVSLLDFQGGLLAALYPRPGEDGHKIRDKWKKEENLFYRASVTRDFVILAPTPDLSCTKLEAIFWNTIHEAQSSRRVVEDSWASDESIKLWISQFYS